MKRIILIVTLLLQLGMSALLHGQFAPNVAYKLTTAWKPDRSLSLWDENKAYPELLQYQSNQGQAWKITPIQGSPGYYKLTTVWKPNLCLSLWDANKAYPEFKPFNSHYSRNHSWKIAPIQASPGYYQLTTAVKPNLSLTLWDENKAYPEFKPFTNVLGQRWQITPILASSPSPTVNNSRVATTQSTDLVSSAYREIAQVGGVWQQWPTQMTTFQSIGSPNPTIRVSTISEGANGDHYRIQMLQNGRIIEDLTVVHDPVETQKMRTTWKDPYMNCYREDGTGDYIYSTGLSLQTIKNDPAVWGSNPNASIYLMIYSQDRMFQMTYGNASATTNSNRFGSPTVNTTPTTNSNRFGSPTVNRTAPTTNSNRFSSPTVNRSTATTANSTDLVSTVYRESHKVNGVWQQWPNNWTTHRSEGDPDPVIRVSTISEGGPSGDHYRIQVIANGSVMDDFGVVYDPAKTQKMRIKWNSPRMNCYFKGNGGDYLYTFGLSLQALRNDPARWRSDPRASIFLMLYSEDLHVQIKYR